MRNNFVYLEIKKGRKEGRKKKGEIEKNKSLSEYIIWILYL